MNDYEQIKARELELADPAVRNNPDRLNKLIADNFEEYGRSGSIYTKQDILATLPRSEAMLYALSDFKFITLCEGCVLLKYLSKNGDKKALRSSIWVKNDADWQLVHHQATEVANTV